MSKNLKISLLMVVAAVGLAFVAASAGGDGGPVETSEGGEAEALVRPDSHLLSEGSSNVTFVEFLDFECEACGAAYPAVEQLRERYGDEVTFVVRHFPLHGNSEAAARAAEAAAAQGEFEAMYQRLFEAQAEWSHSDSSQEDVFFGYAEDLGLDMQEFRTVYDDPATLEKIQRDQADGEALGVTGTPTFFLDGEKLEVQSFQEVVDRIDEAVGA